VFFDWSASRHFLITRLLLSWVNNIRREGRCTHLKRWGFLRLSDRAGSRRGQQRQLPSSHRRQRRKLRRHKRSTTRLERLCEERRWALHCCHRNAALACAENLSYLTWHIKKLKRDHGFRALKSVLSPDERCGVREGRG
jgi:hypothetical protein